MKVFSGFPPGKMHLTVIPSPFFSEVLPDLTDMDELKVLLHVIWRLDQRRGYPCFVTGSELLNDPILCESMAPLGTAVAEHIRQGLEKAAAHGSLIQLSLKRAERSETFYFLNSEKGRQAAVEAKQGALDLFDVALKDGPMLQERSDIFELYEQNIGLVTPMLAEELQDAEATYPREWLEEAFREAAKSNVRNWRYIARILERWAIEGRRELEGQEEDRQRYVKGRYAEYLQRNQDE